MTTFVVISPGALSIYLLVMSLLILIDTGVDLTHFNYLENDTKSILQYHMPIIDSSYTMTHVSSIFLSIIKIK
jgi:hypothetical protein